MTFHQLKCPNCGATLNVDNGLDTFFCQYCGTKLISDGQSDMAIRAKADVILADKAIERDRQQHEYEERKMHLEEKSRSSSFIKMIIVFIIMILFFIIIIKI